MASWVERIKEAHRRALNRREIEAAIREVKGNSPDDPAWREWYRKLMRRLGIKENAAQRER